MYEHNDLKHYIKKENYGISFFFQSKFRWDQMIFRDFALWYDFGDP